ncbi:HU family DNA-binding protein [Streptomyces sp. NPDC014882]|uniref:HU family DNA-binding protein n=1 Tax=Streptomyces sp. NPDC014882 TaxID=3364927 RepID=UPI0036FA9804
MDKSQLAEKTAHRAGDGGNGPRLTADDVGLVLDTLFGTVEHPGTIAEALKGREAVTLGSFGSFQGADGAATFRPGTALTAYLRDQIR